jgi:CPA2 family monovalent cation:H+ antiporter-2
LVFKALAERGQSGPPHGSRAIGILLFQDVALVPLLLLIPLLTGSGEAAGIAQYFALAAISVASVAMIVGLRFCLANWLIPTFAQYRSPEMIVLFTLVCLTAITLTAYRIGLPPAVGAFATGLMFNDNRWSAQIDALVLPFRETFAAIFFVSLGLIFDPATIVGDWAWMTLLLVTMIGWKAVTAGVALLTTGLSPIRALGIGIALAHMGEFSFVLALLGFETGVIDDDTYQRLVAIAVGSLILTPMLTSVGLRMVQSGEVTKESGTAVRRGQAATALASVIGAGPIGRQVASQLEMMGNDVCVIDHSPLNLHAFSAVGLRTVAGDATDRRTLELAGVDACSITVVCVPDDEQAVRIVRAIRELNHRGTLLVRCRYQSNTGRLIRTGANRVVSEEAVASRALMTILSELDS